ncbi:MAG: type II/IV secretion system protein [Candidatus Colwellbacteria bacterium]|nr:type II/IV secretion system protein [Candidatus Colwellbacteria bacterium]
MLHLAPEKLKKLLTESGVVEDANFSSAEKEAQTQGRDVASVLISNGAIPEHYFTELIAKYASVPIVGLVGVKIPSTTLELIPETYAYSKNVAAFEYKKGDFVKVAMLDPFDYETLEFLRVHIGLKVIPHVTTKSGLQNALKQYKEKLGKEFSEIIKESVEKSMSLTGEADLAKVAEAVPVVSTLKSIIEYAISLNSSDIHFEPFDKNLVVRFRIDGVLREIFDLPKAIEPTIVARIKILANLQIDEHRVPQDGRFKFDVGGKEAVDIRVSIIPVLYGEKAEMRLLRSSSRPISLEDLGLSSKAVLIVRDEIQKPHGMILSTGPTGSGKTTTLYAILHILNTSKVNITTIEDPIEYEVPGINQIQVNPKAKVTFSTGLRSILRQDPNIIMVGEIRDSETVAIAIQSALTGHLMLSSLHTNDAPAAIPRLIDMGAAPFLLASTINLVIAQRLVRKICDTCIGSFGTTQQIKRLIEIQLELTGHKYDESVIPKTLYKGAGCNACGDTGYRGLIGVFEVFRVTDVIRQLMLKSASAGELKKEAIKEGMVTLFEDGLEKAKAGVTTIEEVLRVMQE